MAEEQKKKHKKRRTATKAAASIGPMVKGFFADALKAKEEGKEKVILFNWSGHGVIDLAAYDAYLSGKLTKYEMPEEDIATTLAAIEGLPKP